MVAGPAELHGATIAALNGNRSGAGQRLNGFGSGKAVAVIAELDQERGSQGSAHPW